MTVLSPETAEVDRSDFFGRGLSPQPASAAKRTRSGCLATPHALDITISIVRRPVRSLTDDWRELALVTGTSNATARTAAAAVRTPAILTFTSPHDAWLSDHRSPFSKRARQASETHQLAFVVITKLTRCLRRPSLFLQRPRGTRRSMP